MRLGYKVVKVEKSSPDKTKGVTYNVTFLPVIHHKPKNTEVTVPVTENSYEFYSGKVGEVLDFEVK